MTWFSRRKTHTPAGMTNVLDAIPSAYHGAILAGTSTQDVRANIQDAIDGTSQSLWFPRGLYSVDVNVNSLRMVSRSGFKLLGEGYESGRNLACPIIRAQSASLTGSLGQSSMLLFTNCNTCTIAGINWDRNVTYGDCIHMSNCDYALVTHNYFSNVGGITWAQGTANATTNLITRGSDKNTWAGAIANGDRIEFWSGSTVGDALPSPLVKDVGYFARDVSGLSFAVSATVGGAAIDLTTAGVGRWCYRKGINTIENYNTTTEIVNCVGHGFNNGEKILGYNQDNYANTSNGPTWCSPIVSRWVAAVTADTYKIAYDPAGTSVVDLTGAGSLGLKPKFGRAYVGIRGGGNQTSTISFNNYNNCQGAWHIIQSEADNVVKTYGMNSSRICHNIINGTGGIVGGVLLHVHDNDYETIVVPPFEAVMRLQDLSGPTVHFDENYMELGNQCTNSIGVISDGVNTIENNAFFGANGPEVQSVAIAHLTQYAPGRIANNKISGFGGNFVSVRLWATEASQITGNAGAFIYDGFTYGSTSDPLPSGDFLYPNAVRTGTGRFIYRIFRKGIGFEYGGSHLWELRQSANNPTELDLALGNLRQIEGTTAHTISTIKVAGNTWATPWTQGAYGWCGVILADSAFTTLSATAFATLSGADRKMASGESLYATVRADGKVALLEPMGSVVVGTPAALTGTLAASVAAANLFSGAPTVGVYELSVYVRVGTAATTGTLDITLAYNDGSARSVNVIAALDTTVTGPGFANARATFKIASGNPTLAATFTSLTGTPAYTVDAAVRRLS